MEIKLKPELENFLREKIERGQYQSIDEAINQGLELLKNQDEIYQGRFEELKREIMIGAQAADRGEFIDGEIVFEQLKQKLEHRQLLKVEI